MSRKIKHIEEFKEFASKHDISFGVAKKIIVGTPYGKWISILSGKEYQAGYVYIAKLEALKDAIEEHGEVKVRDLLRGMH